MNSQYTEEISERIDRLLSICELILKTERKAGFKKIFLERVFNLLAEIKNEREAKIYTPNTD